MNRDDVIRMASSIGFELEVNLPALERFANLVWNHALESAAKLVDEPWSNVGGDDIRSMKVGAGDTAQEE